MSPERKAPLLAEYLEKIGKWLLVFGIATSLQVSERGVPPQDVKKLLPAIPKRGLKKKDG